MLELFCPDLYVESLLSLDLEALKGKGIRGVVLDIDNTIVEWGSEAVASEVKLWFARAKELGFKMCTLSNGFRRRINSISGVLDLPVANGFLKPTKGAFRKALEVLGTRPYETAIVGDQVFTDVLGGNLMGLYTILVRPLCEREFVTTRLVRKVERVLLRFLTRRGMLAR